MSSFAINFNILHNHHFLNHPSPNYNTITIDGVEYEEEQCPECFLIISRETVESLSLPD